MSPNHVIKPFLVLLKAGLWGEEAILAPYGGIDFSEVYRIAEEQNVTGIVAAGLEYVSDVKIPQECAFRFAGRTLQIERQNKSLNGFIAELIRKLHEAGIDALLVKGQGIAQCYEKPLWRACGDVDFLLDDENYKKAKVFLGAISSSVEEEILYHRHSAMTIDGWSVELHGSLRSGLGRRIDRTIDMVQANVFSEGKKRLWLNGDTKVSLPPVDEDIVFVFAHILQHFYKEGIGLKQICDWCRLLWTQRESLNLKLLESRIKRMGVMNEWKSFAALAVDYLGMPAVAMPFYSLETKWGKKASRVVMFILETGSFGHNRDYSYRQEYPYILVKTISLWRHLADLGKYFVVFPLNSLLFTWRRICVGLFVALKGKKHE